MENRLRVLVLEDEWPARKYLVELIEGTGLADLVGAVGGLGEARALLATLPVDVVFVDVQLSCGENGLDLVRSAANGPRPTFVLATASRQHAAEASKLGVAEYLLKPFSDEGVEKCLRRLLAKAADVRHS